MIQEETVLEVADNTGAKKVRCFRILGGTGKRYATVGEVIRCSVIEAEPKASVKKKEKVRVVIVRTKRRVKRDGELLCFYGNACVIIDDKNNPIGTRVFGPIAREVRDAGFMKIASLAPEVV